MSAHAGETDNVLRREFGRLRPPERITQEAFDYNNRHLKKLVQLHPGDRAEVHDLWEYTQDLRFSKDIQESLLRYVLPFCLEAWRRDLRGEGGYGGFVEHFYPALVDRHIIETFLTPAQSAAVSRFMRDTILEEIDQQRGLSYRGSNARPYRWTTTFTTYGVVLPDIEHLCDAWWSLATIGSAVAAVQYISCLMYSEVENPVFAPWTSDQGGGPPCLWEFGGHLYTHRWLEPNVQFLSGFLNAGSVIDVLTRAAAKLEQRPEHAVAAEILEDVPLCEETLQSRCAELPRLLATVQQTTHGLEWSQ